MKLDQDTILTALADAGLQPQAHGFAENGLVGWVSYGDERGGAIIAEKEARQAAELLAGMGIRTEVKAPPMAFTGKWHVKLRAVVEETQDRAAQIRGALGAARRAIVARDGRAADNARAMLDALNPPVIQHDWLVEALDHRDWERATRAIDAIDTKIDEREKPPKRVRGRKDETVHAKREWLRLHHQVGRLEARHAAIVEGALESHRRLTQHEAERLRELHEQIEAARNIRTAAYTDAARW
jgi:hypothetical protein